MNRRPPLRRPGPAVWLAVVAMAAMTATGILRADTGTGRRDMDPPARPEEGIFLGRFIFSPSGVVTVGYDDNTFAVEDGFDPDGTTAQDITGNPIGTRPPQEAQPDTLTIGKARLGLKLPFSHSYVSVAWSPQYRQYSDYRLQTTFSQQASLDARLNFSNGTSIRLQDDYLDGTFQARRLDGDRFGRKSTPYRRNLTALDYDWSPAQTWGLAGRLERTDFVYERTEVTEFQDTLAGTSGGNERLFEFFDFVTDSIETQGYRNFSRFQIFASATVARTRQDRRKFNESRREFFGCGEPPDPIPPGDPCAQLWHETRFDSEQIDQVDAGLGVRGRISPLTTADLKVGYANWRFKEDRENPPFSGLSLSGNVEHAFNRRTTALLRVQRQAHQATGQITGYYVREEAFIGLERRLTMQLTARAGVTGRRSIFQSPSFSIRDLDTTAELRYRPGQSGRPGPLSVALSYALQRSSSSQEGLNVDRQRLELSVQFGWF